MQRLRKNNENITIENQNQKKNLVYNKSNEWLLKERNILKRYSSSPFYFVLDMHLWNQTNKGCTVFFYVQPDWRYTCNHSVDLLSVWLEKW